MRAERFPISTEVAAPVAVWTDCRNLVNPVRPIVGQPFNVVHLEEWFTASAIRSLGAELRRRRAAALGPDNGWRHPQPAAGKRALKKATEGGSIRCPEASEANLKRVQSDVYLLPRERDAVLGNPSFALRPSSRTFSLAEHIARTHLVRACG
jgi:hypothetical protein